MEQDRRKPWDGHERRGCYFDPKASAREIAGHLDAIAIARREAAIRETNERTGRYIRSWSFFFRILRTIGILGAPILAWLHGSGKISLSLFSAG